MNSTARHIAVALTTVITAATFASTAANAKPDRIGDGPSSPRLVVTDSEERPCFMVRANWNVSLDGPQPTCPNGWR